MSETTNATNYSIRSNLHQLTVQCQNKLALNPFDDKRMYLNPTQSLPWDEHTQFILLYHKDLCKASKTVEEIYLNVWY